MDRLKLIALGTLCLYVLVVIFSFGIGMQMNQDGSMADCPFMMEDGALCSMNGVEHLNLLKQNFVAMVQGKDNVLNMLLLLTGVVFFIHTYFLHSNGFVFYKKKNYFSNLFNHILRSLFEGDLNPRLYNT